MNYDKKKKNLKMPSKTRGIIGGIHRENRIRKNKKTIDLLS